MQVDEEDVDHIGVVGEEEEETRVSIFSFSSHFISIASLICCLLSGLALQAGECLENTGQIF